MVRAVGPSKFLGAVLLGLRSQSLLRPRLVWGAPLALGALPIRIHPGLSVVKWFLLNLLCALKNILTIFDPGQRMSRVPG